MAIPTKEESLEFVTECVVAIRDAKTDDEQAKAVRRLTEIKPSRVNLDLMMQAGIANVLATVLHEWNDATPKNQCAGIVGQLVKMDHHHALVQAGILEPLVAFLPYVIGDTSRAAFALYWMINKGPDMAQCVRDTPSVMEGLRAMAKKDIAYVDMVLEDLECLEVSGRAVKAARAAEAAREGN